MIKEQPMLLYFSKLHETREDVDEPGDFYSPFLFSTGTYIALHTVVKPETMTMTENNNALNITHHR
jgi:hypothetical protein